MAEKLLKLKIQTSVEGSKTLVTLEEILKKNNVAIKAFSTSMSYAEDGTKGFTSSVTASAKEIANLEKALKRLESDKTLEKGLTVGSKGAIQEKDLLKDREKALKAKLVLFREETKAATTELNKRMSLEQAIYTKGYNSKEALVAKTAQKEFAVRKEYAAKILKLEQDILAGKNKGLVTQARAKANAELEKELSLLKKITSQQATFAQRLNSTARVQASATFQNIEANRKMLQGMSKVTAEARKGTTAVKQQTTAQKGNASAVSSTTSKLQTMDSVNKSILNHVTKIVLQYRAANLVFNKLRDAALAIPAAGIAEQSNKAGLTGVFGTAQTAESLKGVQELSQELGLNMVSLETSFSKFAPSAVLAGASLQEATQAFEDFSTVGMVLHKTPDEMQGIFVALEQMFAKGTVMSEEIKRQLGNRLPAAVEIAAESMHMLPKEFMAAMKEGQIVAKEFIPKFAAFYKKIFAPEGLVESVSEMFQSQLQRVLNSAEMLFRESFKGLEGTMVGVLSLTTSALDTLRENLGLVALAAKALATVLTVRLIVALVSTTKNMLATATASKVMDVSLMSSVVRVKGLTGALTNMGALLKKSRVGLVGIAVAMTGISAPAIALLGTIVASGVALFKLSGLSLEYGKGQKEAITLTDKMTASLEKNKALIGLNAEQRANAIDFVVKKIAEEDAAVNAFRISYKGGSVTLASFTKAIWQQTGKFITGVWDSVKVGTKVAFEKFTSYGKAFFDKTIERFAQLKGAFMFLATLAETMSFKKATAAYDDSVKASIIATKEFATGTWEAVKESVDEGLEETGDAISGVKDTLGDFVAPTLKLGEAIDAEALGKRYAAGLDSFREAYDLGESKKKFQGIALSAAAAKKLTANIKEAALNLARFRNLAEQAAIEVLKLNGQLEEASDREIELDFSSELLKASEMLNKAVAAKNKGLEKEARILLDNLKTLRAAEKVQARGEIRTNKHVNKLKELAFATRRVNELEEQGLLSISDAYDLQIDLKVEGLLLQEKQINALEKEASLLGGNLEILERIKEAKEVKATIEGSSTRDSSGLSSGLSFVGMEFLEDPLTDIGDADERHRTGTAVADKKFQESGNDIAGETADEAFGRKFDAEAEHNARILELDVQLGEDRAAIQDQYLGGSAQKTAKLFGGMASMGAEAMLSLTQANIRMHGEGSKQAKRAFIAYKAFKIAEAGIATAAAIIGFLADPGGPQGVVLSVLAGVMGVAQVAQIAATPMPSAHGGLDYVPSEETYLLDKGERVLSPNQNRDLTGFLQRGKSTREEGGVEGSRGVNIINVLDSTIVADYLQSTEGEDIIMNIMRQNEVA